MSNAIAEAAEAQGLAKLLIEYEVRKIGDRKAARERVARLVGASPGTIENITRNRLKRISGWLRDALRARAIAALEGELIKLQHELSILKQTGVDPRSNEMAAVQADVSAVLSVLRRK